VHPSNDLSVIAGQGTAALGLIEEIQYLNTLIVPVGGGGLSSGSALGVKGLSPDTQITGVEPEGANDAYRSLQQGELLPSPNPDTILDGLLTPLGTNTFPILKRHLTELVTVSDAETVEAMRLLWRRLKLVIEPSAAVAFAPILNGKISVEGKRVGIILSGGNVNLDKLPW
jgi:threonine dehydratase